MPTLRLPLLEDVEPRLADSSKDGLASNVFFDKNKQGTTYATKRPGLTSYVVGQGDALGLYGGFIWDGTATYSDIVWNGTRFCGISGDQGIYTNNNTLSITSTNGTDWEQGFMPSAAQWYGVAWDGTYFVAVGQDVAGRSTDGKTWSALSIATGDWSAIIANGTTLVALDELNARVGYSTDSGSTWAYQNLPAAAQTYRDIAYSAGAGLYLVITNGTASATSPNLTAWTARTLPADNHFNTTANSTTYVIARRGAATAYTSTDAINWTERTLAVSDNSYRDITWTGSQFVLIGAEASSSPFYPTVQYSANGATWTRTPLTPTSLNFNNNSPACVAGNADVVVILQQGAYALNSYYYSTDDMASVLLGNLKRWLPYPTTTY